MGEWGLLHWERGSWCVVGKGPVEEPRAHTVELSVCLRGWRGGDRFPVMCRRDCTFPQDLPVIENRMFTESGTRTGHAGALSARKY